MFFSCSCLHTPSFVTNLLPSAILVQWLNQKWGERKGKKGQKPRKGPLDTTILCKLFRGHKQEAIFRQHLILPYTVSTSSICLFFIATAATQAVVAADALLLLLFLLLQLLLLLL